MVFYPKVHQSKRVKGMRNLLGLLCAKDAERKKKCAVHDFGEGEDAGNALKIFGKGNCN